MNPLEGRLMDEFDQSILDVAYTLRATEDLSQANFLKLVGLAAKFQFQSLLQFLKAKPSEDKDNKLPAGENP